MLKKVVLGLSGSIFFWTMTGSVAREMVKPGRSGLPPRSLAQSTQAPAGYEKMKVGFYCQPAFLSGTIYFTARDKLYAVSAETGRLLSQMPIPLADGITPVVLDRTLYLGTTAGTLLAVDPKNGKTKWQFSTQFTDMPVTPAVAGATVFTGSADGKVFALDAGTGKEIARYDLQKNGRAEQLAALDSHVVLVGTTDGKLIALDMTSKTPRWMLDFKKMILPVTIADGALYFGNWDANMYALDLASKKIKWSRPIDVKVGSRPVVAGGLVYCQDGVGTCYAFDRANGDVKWSYKTSGESSLYLRPVVANGLVCVGNAAGEISCLDAATGHLQWKFKSGALSYTPAVGDKGLFIASEDGNLYALDLTSGKQLWRYETETILRKIPRFID